jgi:hypothetical protein
MNKRLMRMAAIVLLGAVAFVSVAEAGALFPAGEYKKGSQTLRVSAAGDYEVTYMHEGKPKVWTSGFALHEGFEVCYSGERKGNLWTVSNGGTGQCFQSTVRDQRLIIQSLSNNGGLGGVWVKK